MKTLRFILAILAGAFFFQACDNFDEDERRTLVVGETDERAEITVVQSEQAVLLEDFTGWKCSNCPQGTEILNNLKSTYGKRVVIAAFHAGSFAKPNAENDSLDLRTEYGENVRNQFNVKRFPIVLLDRQETETAIDNWAAKTAERLNKPHLLNLSLGAKISNGRVIVSLLAEAVANIQNNLTITLYLTESGIEGKQTTPDGVEQYTFNHVLRSGERSNLPLATEPMAKGDKVEKSYFFDLSKTNVVKPENCAVVVIATDNESGAVVQVNEIELD